MDIMDIEKAINILELLSPYLEGAVVLIFLMVLARKSSFLFFHHVWKNKLNIDLDINNQELSELIENKKDIEKLKIYYPKIIFYSVSHAINLLTWANSNNVSEYELQKYQQHIKFNRKKPSEISFSLPKFTHSERTLNALLSLSFLALIALMISILPVSGFGKSILVKTNTTDVMLMINNNSTITYDNIFFGEDELVNRDNCHTLKNMVGVNEKESAAFCRLIDEKDTLNEYFKVTKEESKKTSIILLPILFFGFFYFLIFKLQADNLIKFSESILDEIKPPMKRKSWLVRSIRIIFRIKKKHNGKYQPPST